MTLKRNVDVMIVGGGAAGLAASMILSSYGISTYLASRYPRTSNLPKAHIISVKSMEIFRELGMEDAIRAICTPPEMMRYAGIYAGFAGEGPDYGRVIARIGAWGRGGQDLDWREASTVTATNLMQSQLEPLMKARAEAMAPDTVHFNTNYQSFTEMEDGIVATLEDRETGEVYEIGARYLLACDGGRAVAPQLGIEMQGHLAVATSVSIHFTADLSAYYHDSEALTATILNPDTGLPCVLVPMGPWPYGADSPEWLVHLVSFAGDHKLFDDDTAVQTMKHYLGLPDLDAKVLVINRWPLDAVVASRFSAGRVFMLGDAIHRMPPAGGHGLNSAIQDAYNLCWKLAAVIKGQARPALLDTYEAERMPYSKYVVATAFKGWQSNPELFKALRFGPKNTPEQNWASLRAVWQDGPEGDDTRRRLARVLPALLPNYHSLNVGYGYTYDEGALIPDGSEKRMSSDPLAPYQASTRPGHTLPDRWVEDLVGRVALGDRIGRGRFTLIAGEAGQAWRDAARQVAKQRGLPLDAFTVGTTEGDLLDMRHSWIPVREHGPEGAVLVRPDRFVAWRSMGAAANPAAILNEVFDTLLK